MWKEACSVTHRLLFLSMRIQITKKKRKSTIAEDSRDESETDRYNRNWSASSNEFFFLYLLYMSGSDRSETCFRDRSSRDITTGDESIAGFCNPKGKPYRYTGEM